jgi:hypothetical protein
MDILTGAKIAELQTDKNFALLFVIQWSKEAYYVLSMIARTLYKFFSNLHSSVKSLRFDVLNKFSWKTATISFR